MPERDLAKAARAELWREADARQDVDELGWSPLVEYARDAPSYMLILPVGADGGGDGWMRAASPGGYGSGRAEVGGTRADLEAALPAAVSENSRASTSESESDIVTYDGKGNVRVQKRTCKDGKCSDSDKEQKASTSEGGKGLMSIVSSQEGGEAGGNKDEGAISDLSNDSDAVSKDIQRAHHELAEGIRRMHKELAGIRASFGADGLGDIMDSVFDGARHRPGSWFAEDGDAPSQQADAQGEVGSVVGTERVETYMKDGQLVTKTKKCDGEGHCVEDVVTRALRGQSPASGKQEQVAKAQAKEEAVTNVLPGKAPLSGKEEQVAKAQAQDGKPHHGPTWPF